MHTGANWYWKWRLSPWSKPWFVIKTFFFLHWNVYKIANHLEDCMNTLGPAKRIDQIGENNHRLYCAIKNVVSGHLINRMNYTLPNGNGDKIMSLLGKWLLIHCDNNMNINLHNHKSEIANLGFRLIDMRIKAILLGIKVI